MTEPSSPARILDSARLNELQQDVGPEIVAQLIDMFLDDGPGRLGTVRDGVQVTDATAAVDVLHSWKSSAATLGAMRLSDLLEQTERLIRAGQVAEATRMVEPIEDAFAQTVVQLREYRQRLG